MQLTLHHLKKVLWWIATGIATGIAGTVLAFLWIGERLQSAKARLAKQDRLRQVEDATRRGDTDALDEQWKDRR